MKSESPLAPAALNVHPAEAVRRSDGGEGAPLILNVEDGQSGQPRRARLFAEAGFTVVEAASAREALALATHRPASVALIDIRLPDASGIALCETVKRLRPALPVLLLSTSGIAPAEKSAALAAGAFDVLSGPLTPDMLLRAVHHALAPDSTERVSEAWILTDASGIIIDTSRQGARLLSGSRRGLQRRNLIIFFEQDRDGWRAAMDRAVAGERVRRSGRIRPKERRPIMVDVEVAKAPDVSPTVLIWSFEPQPD